jgi:hypothetical protein
MPLNGNGKDPRKKPRAKRPGPTPAQQRARREYVKMTGHKISRALIDKIRSQWTA